jgi:hypothetical protein
MLKKLLRPVTGISLPASETLCSRMQNRANERRSSSPVTVMHEACTHPRGNAYYFHRVIETRVPFPTVD